MIQKRTKINTVPLKELRENMSEYIQRVSDGESFTIFRRSNPIFRITPVDTEEGWESIIDFTAIDKQGVPAEKVLQALKAMHGKN